MHYFTQENKHETFSDWEKKEKDICILLKKNFVEFTRLKSKSFFFKLCRELKIIVLKEKEKHETKLGWKKIENGNEWLVEIPRTLKKL